MMKYIQARELVKSSLFVREPVEDLNRKLSSSNSKRMIVSGGRGIGKSVVLFNQELKNLGNEAQTIFMSFDSIIAIPENYNEIFDEKFINHYYEVHFCWKLLNYIERNYSLTYENYFKQYEQTLQEITNKMYHYINNSLYEKVIIAPYITPTDFSKTILSELKKQLKIEFITLAIDRFDWTNGSSSLAQHILSNYFELFDQVIITTDDETLENETNREILIQKGYSFIDIQYGKNEAIIKEIIRKRIRKYNNNCSKEEPFREDMITNEIYQELIHQTNGNISCMINCVGDVIEDFEWTDGNMDLQQSFANHCTKQLNKTKEYKLMDANPPKLYL